MPGSLRRRLDGTAPRRPPDRAMVEDVIEYLEWMAIRPAMYFGGICAQDTSNSLSYFRQAFEFAGLDIDPGADVEASHGWRRSPAMGVVGQMHEKGMSEAETVDEVIRIEIDKWRAVLQRLGGPTSTATEELRAAAADLTQALAGPADRAGLVGAACAVLEYVAECKPTDADWRLLGACSRALERARVAESEPDRVSALLREAGAAFVLGFAGDDEQAEYGPVGRGLLARARSLHAELAADRGGRQ